MQMMPLVEFYLKHRVQIEALVEANNKPGEASLVLDLASALVPVIKKHWPSTDTDGLIDDALTTLKQVLA